MGSLRVAIVGSGLTGLLVAQGLRKKNISATVFERDSFLDERPRDWTLMLHWGLDSLDNILPRDVLDKFPEAYCDPFYESEHPPDLPCLHGSTGEVLFRIPSTRMRLISRKRFRRVLSHGVDIQYGKGLASIVDDDGQGPVTLRFEDGTIETADIVIGADGPNSAVRTHLLGPERAKPIATPWAISLVSCTFNNALRAQFARGLHPVWHMSYGPRGICAMAVSDVKEANDPKDWDFTFVRLWSEVLPKSLKGEEALRRFKEKTASECEPYGSASQWIPEGSRCHIDQLKYWVPEPWGSEASCGRITLAGDAAHTILPYRAQGFNTSMEDSLKLIDCIARISDGADRREVLGEYDREVCARGSAAVLASLEEGKKKMDINKLMTSKTATQGLAKRTAEVKVAVVPVAED